MRGCSSGSISSQYLSCCRKQGFAPGQHLPEPRSLQVQSTLQESCCHLPSKLFQVWRLRQRPPAVCGLDSHRGWHCSGAPMSVPEALAWRPFCLASIASPASQPAPHLHVSRKHGSVLPGCPPLLRGIFRADHFTARATAD